MRIFFDTEFTQFRDGELLSIGLVTDADQTLVVEIHDAARHGRASDFCKQNVLPQFGATAAISVADDAAAGNAVADWIAQFPGPIELCFDYKLDWWHLEASLRAAGRWDSLMGRLTGFNVSYVAESARCLDAQQQFFERQGGPRQHHPLIDARALRERWREHERELTETYETSLEPKPAGAGEPST